MKQKQVTSLYYGFQFFFSLLIWLPIFYEYQRRIGLGSSEIFTIQSIYYAFFCFLEIPTGLLADSWGRLRCLRWGALILVCSNLLPVLFPGFKGFLCHFLLLAVARSLISGTASAYLYDWLDSQGKSKEFKKIEGKARSYSLIGKVVCWSSVGFMMQWLMPLPYLLTALAAFIAFGFACLLPEFSEEGNLKESSLRLGRAPAVMTMMINAPLVPIVMLEGVAIFVLSRVWLVNLFQPLLTEKTFHFTSFGMVMAFMTLFEALGSRFPEYLRKWFSDSSSILILTVIAAFSLIFMMDSNRGWTLVALCLFSLVIGLFIPIQRQLLNDTIPDRRYRATLLSVESILDRALCSWASAQVADDVTGGKIRFFLGCSAWVTLASVFVLFGMVRWISRGNPRFSKESL